MTETQDGQVSLFDQDTWYGKTSSVPCPATKGATSRQSSKKQSASQSRKPPIFQCLKRDGLHTEDSATWTDDGLWLGECWTRNTGESPNVAVESRLSQILEARPHPKYSLTPKACGGILRRAERRGKDLPMALKVALIHQSQGVSPQEQMEVPALTEDRTSYAVRIRGGCDGGGKGALVQEERSGTLGTHNDQTLFTGCLTPYDTQANRVYGNQGVFPPLQAREKSWMNRESVFCLQGNGINRSDEAGCAGKGWREDVSYTLNTIDRPAVCAAFKLGNSETARSIGFAEEQAPTLNAECGGNKPAVMYFDMTHANDVIRECGDVVPTLQSRMGTGGNQVPLTYQKVAGTLSPGAHAGSYNGQDAYNDMFVVSQEISPSLRARGNDPFRTDMAAYVASVDCRNGTENGDVNDTLQAKSNGGTSCNLNNVCRERGIVRRLTPLECERLQGFTDGWTDIGAWTDEKGKLHKESSDSARYKALGNSIALPPWKWVLKRLCAQYERDATMGSLFSGVGGFDLIWTLLNGRGSVKWESEIEQFPIAVTKKHFGDEESGQTGDLYEALFGRNKKEDV